MIQNRLCNLCLVNTLGEISNYSFTDDILGIIAGKKKEIYKIRAYTRSVNHVFL